MPSEPTDAELNRQWREHWLRVGPLLEARRRAEHAAMTDDERRASIRRVLEMARPNPPSRTTSGLVEYYRKLRKLSR